MGNEDELSGFLDRELGDEAQADLNARVARDDRLQAELTQLRRNDDLVRSAFAAPISEAVPDRFIKLIDAGLANRDKRATAPSNDNSMVSWRIGGAMAASLALGLLLGPQMTNVGGDATISVALADVLDSTPSARTVALKSGERVTPALTFARAGGGYCRQFTVAAATTQRAGLACRTNNQWAVEALLPADPVTPSTDGYVTAAGTANPVLDHLVDQLRVGDPLDQAAEASLIAQHWH